MSLKEKVHPENTLNMFTFEISDMLYLAANLLVGAVFLLSSSRAYIRETFLVLFNGGKQVKKISSNISDNIQEQEFLFSLPLCH